MHDETTTFALTCIFCLGLDLTRVLEKKISIRHDSLNFAPIQQSRLAWDGM